MVARTSTHDVLVVEDDKDIRESVVELLEEEGYPVRGVANGAAALEYLRTNGVPCVILLDLMMPVMDGWEFRVEQQKDAALAAIPVVLLSADADVRAKADAMNASEALSKPVGLQELLDTVERYCRTP